MTARTYDNDPTPLEVAEYFAEAVAALRNEAYARTPYDPKVDTEDIVDAQITLADIKRRVELAMAAKGEAFSSSYRHEVTPGHSLAYRVLGSTVGMNHKIWGALKVKGAV